MFRRKTPSWVTSSFNTATAYSTIPTADAMLAYIYSLHLPHNHNYYYIAYRIPIEFNSKWLWFRLRKCNQFSSQLNIEFHLEYDLCIHRSWNEMVYIYVQLHIQKMKEQLPLSHKKGYFSIQGEMNNKILIVYLTITLRLSIPINI